MRMMGLEAASASGFAVLWKICNSFKVSGFLL